MARKFFNQKVKKSTNISTGTIVIITICILLIIIAIGVIISVSNNKKHKNAVIKIRDSVAVEVNSKLPDKTLFFTELENVKESDIDVSFANANIAKVGEYNIILKIYGEKYKSTLVVVDTESPNLIPKDLNINVGENYSANDFVDKCSDNSNDKCIIEFYDLSLNQEGNRIDYSSYKKQGTYIIQIVAKDETGNVTAPLSAQLTIGESTYIPTNCNYGNSEYDKSKYTLAVNVTENNCALDLNLYQNETTLASAKALIENEEKKLKNEFKTLNLNVKDIYLNSSINPVLNNSGTGLVGYTISMELSIFNTKNEKELIASYYLNQNGKRIYNINTYNLK